MNISELHGEWLRLGDRACRKVTPTAYQELRDWEREHADQWDELVRHDIELKRARNDVPAQDVPEPA